MALTTINCEKILAAMNQMNQVLETMKLDDEEIFESLSALLSMHITTSDDLGKLVSDLSECLVDASFMETMDDQVSGRVARECRIKPHLVEK